MADIRDSDDIGLPLIRVCETPPDPPNQPSQPSRLQIIPLSILIDTEHFIQPNASIAWFSSGQERTQKQKYSQYHSNYRTSTQGIPNPWHSLLSPYLMICRMFPALQESEAPNILILSITALQKGGVPLTKTRIGSSKRLTTSGNA
jgi:hypothetical protein